MSKSYRQVRRTVKIQMTWLQALDILLGHNPRFEYGLGNSKQSKALFNAIKNAFPEGAELLKQEEKAWKIIKETSSDKNPQIVNIDSEIDKLSDKRSMILKENDEELIKDRAKKFKKAKITYFEPTNGFSLKWSPIHPERSR